MNGDEDARNSSIVDRDQIRCDWTQGGWMDHGSMETRENQMTSQKADSRELRKMKMVEIASRDITRGNERLTRATRVLVRISSYPPGGLDPINKDANPRPEHTIIRSVPLAAGHRSATRSHSPRTMSVFFLPTLL